MEKIKRSLAKAIFPHSVVTILLTLVSAAMLIYTFAAAEPLFSVRYASYALSAYTLTVICAKIPYLCKSIRKIKQENRFAARYFADAALRVKISLYGSFSINVLYASLQLALGLINRSVWFLTLAAYYILLAFMRFFLLKNGHRDGFGRDLYREYLSCRSCGVVLLLMNAALSFMSFYIVSKGEGFAYNHIATIGMAAYTFFIFTAAAVNLVRYRKYNSPVISASKTVNLAAALVSMLSLETAMLSAFGGENSQHFRKLMTAGTSAAVCVIVLSMAIYMIVHSSKRLNRFEKESFKDE